MENPWKVENLSTYIPSSKTSEKSRYLTIDIPPWKALNKLKIWSVYNYIPAKKTSKKTRCFNIESRDQ